MMLEESSWGGIEVTGPQQVKGGRENSVLRAYQGLVFHLRWRSNCSQDNEGISWSKKLNRLSGQVGMCAWHILTLG